MEKKLIEYIETNSIGISSIADDNVESYLNQQAVINRLTMFYSRVLRGGKTARIMRVIPGVDACLTCLSLYNSDNDDKYINIPEDQDLPIIMNECNNPIRPASAADIKLVASITSRIIIEFLEGKKSQFNQWIYFSEDLSSSTSLKYSSTYPYSVFADKIEIHPRCPLCNSNDEKINIIISNDTNNLILKEVDNAKNIETGGILIGKKESNNVFVKIATLPGPNAVKEKCYFLRDRKYCQNILDKEFSNYGNVSIYVGEWHYHPTGRNFPSNQDLKSLAEISGSVNYLTDEPIMIIASKNREISCTVHPVNHPYYNTEFKIEGI